MLAYLFLTPKPLGVLPILSQNMPRLINVSISPSVLDSNVSLFAVRTFVFVLRKLSPTYNELAIISIIQAYILWWLLDNNIRSFS